MNGVLGCANWRFNEFHCKKKIVGRFIHQGLMQVVYRFKRTKAHLMCFFSAIVDIECIFIAHYSLAFVSRQAVRLFSPYFHST